MDFLDQPIFRGASPKEACQLHKLTILVVNMGQNVVHHTSKDRLKWHKASKQYTYKDDSGKSISVFDKHWRLTE